MSDEAELWGPLRTHDDLMDAIRRILEGVLPITGADSIAYVFPVTGQGRPFRVGASASGGTESALADTAIPDDYVPLREAMLFRRTFFSQGEEAGDWAISGVNKAAASPTGVAAAPVSIDGTVEGAILALRTAEGQWVEPVGQALEMAAFLAARELAAARRRFRAHRYLAMQEGFHALIRRIAEISEKAEAGAGEGVSTRKEVYRATVEQVRRHLDARRVLLIEAEQGGRNGRIAWESGSEGSADKGEKAALGGSYVEWVLAQGVHRIFSGESAASGRIPVLPPAWTGAEGGACLLVPVPPVPDGFHGVIACESEKGRAFDVQDAESVKDILAVMRMGISHAMRLENLEKEAKNDGLTGLLNRKTFCLQFANLLSRLDGRYPCAVIMLDIDHFKKVNDTYGHPAGDEVLRKVSSVIRKTIRKVDMAGRYGGEEFVIYLHSTDQAHAGIIAERLRLIIRQTVFVFDKREVGVTASLGIACYPGDGKTAEELLRNADIALYRSKQGGRDRTTKFLKQ
jgi:diguanylate cyclase (GGDEF)-like protein